MRPTRRGSFVCVVVPTLALLLSACALAPLPLSRATEVRKVEADDSTASQSADADAEPSAPSEFRITCKYEMGNCERRARKVCNGAYAVLDRSDGSCAKCGWSLNSDDVGSPVFRGSLHVRCR